MNKVEEIVLELMPTKEFNQFLDRHIDFVKKTMEKQKNFEPMLIIQLGKGNCIPVLFGDLPSDHDVKVKMMHGIGHKIATEVKDDIVIAVCFMSEVWYATADAKGKMAPEVTLPLSQSPLKTEGIGISCSTLDGRQNMSLMPIMRAKNGKAMILEEKVTTSYCDGKEDKSVNTILGSFWKAYILTKIKGGDNA